jgi:GNAT superfamily N-acetyltransferase
VVSLSLPNTPAAPASGLRPVNLKTDLAPLADLIELAFMDSMDSSGRAAVREMRAMSRFGPGLGVLGGMNDLVQGIGLGFVYIEDGQLIGNASIYPAHLPPGAGPAWIIANVAVHPDYRGRGIARQLMNASLAAIRKRAHERGKPAVALLQVEADNLIARRLYDSLGFVQQGFWTQWRRSPLGRKPAPIEQGPFITQRRRGEWRAEFALAQRLRPPERGGLGWLRPLTPSLFKPSIWRAINDAFNMRSCERLIIRTEDERAVRSALWIERALAASSVQLVLMVDPDYQGLDDNALIHLAVRRFGASSALTIEHPAAEAITNTVLEHYGFRAQRTLLHMRWQG